MSRATREGAGDPLGRDLWDQADALAAGDLSSVELVEACQERIARHDATYRAFISVAGERALADARALDDERARSGPRGPLHGIPIAVKDNVDVEGVPTTAGSRLLPDVPAAADAPLMAGLRGAGAIVVGKANLDEFAYGFSTQNPHFGTASNPWDPSRVAGGSSGGSAVAVALGMCSAAVGTDTNGSIRVPAAYCGLVGLRPTYGRVSLRGVVPLAASYEQPSPIARTVRDMALLLPAMSGYDPGYPGSADVPVPNLVAALEAGAGETFTLAVPRADFLRAAEEPVRAAVEAALVRLAQAGHRLHDVELRETGRGTLASAAITSRESADAVPDEELKNGEGLGQVARERLSSRFGVSDVALRVAREASGRIRAELLAVLEGADAVACATSPLLPPHPEDTAGPSPVAGLARGRYIGHFTGPFGLAGLPAMSLPCGRSPEGLPVGLQLVGRPFEEGRLLCLARAVEDALGLVDLRPPAAV